MNINIFEEKQENTVSYRDKSMDNLPYKIGVLFKAQDDLCKLAKDFDVPFFSVCHDMESKQGLGSQHIAKEGVSSQELAARLNQLVELLDSKIRHWTNGQYGVMPIAVKIDIKVAPVITSPKVV